MERVSEKSGTLSFLPEGTERLALSTPPIMRHYIFGGNTMALKVILVVIVVVSFSAYIVYYNKLDKKYEATLEDLRKSIEVCERLTKVCEKLQLEVEAMYGACEEFYDKEYVPFTERCEEALNK